MRNKIFLAGKIASGKSTVTQTIAQHIGFPYISYGGILRHYSRENGLPQTRESLQALGQNTVNQYGYKGFVDWAMEYSSHIAWDGPLIVDGVRHPLVYERILEIFPEAILIYCDCDEETQIKRIEVRDGLERDKILEIISHETEKHISELESYADIVYRPESNIGNVIEELEVLMSSVTVNDTGPV